MATPPTQPALHLETVEALLRLLEERIHVVEIYGAGGCPTCHEGEARGFAFRLRGLLTATHGKGMNQP